MNGLTDFEVEQLDFLLAKYDKAGLTPEGKSEKLFKAGQKFNPKPASRQAINDYIRNRNGQRYGSDQLPQI